MHEVSASLRIWKESYLYIARYLKIIFHDSSNFSTKIQISLRKIFTTLSTDCVCTKWCKLLKTRSPPGFNKFAVREFNSIADDHLRGKLIALNRFQID